MSRSITANGISSRCIRANTILARSIGVLGGRREPLPPSPYQVLPYIVSKGNSWADTGLYLDPTIHRIQGSFIVDDLSMVSFGSVYLLEGARNNASAGQTKCSTLIKKLSESEYQIRLDWGILSTSTVYESTIFEVGKEYSFDFTPEYVEINGIRVERIAQSNGACINSYFIGSMNDPAVISAGYNPPGIRATKRIITIWSSGETIGNIDPVMVKADGTYNMYDKIRDSVLENKGTEPFTKGETDTLLTLHSGGFLRLHSGAFLKLH